VTLIIRIYAHPSRAGSYVTKLFKKDQGIPTQIATITHSTETNIDQLERDPCL
jgi:hypothetical protein